MRRRNPPPTPTPGGSWQIHMIPVAMDGQVEFVLPYPPAVDASGDPLIRVDYSGGSYTAPSDFQIAGALLQWGPDIPLAAGESLIAWIVPA